MITSQLQSEERRLDCTPQCRESQPNQILEYMKHIPSPEDIANESDVEQKIIMPLLVESTPDGLGYPTSSIKTKPNIRKYQIGKGNEAKLYFPDYIIVVSGLPAIVIEAKGPGENLDDAYREARLYATEINSAHPSGVNPLSRVVCSNGKELIAGRWDEAAPSLSISTSDLISSNVDFAELSSFCSYDTVKSEYTVLASKLNPDKYFRPLQYVGGSAVQSEEVGHNDFGASISFEYRHLFNPISREERSHIVRNAYITSSQRRRYIEPIDRIIRAATPHSELDATLIRNTDSPEELIGVLENQKSLEQQVLLLIGGVGAGKSTFVDYLREVALPNDLSESLLWINVNMNDAPIDEGRIYDWMCDEIISELESFHPEYDFDELGQVQKVFGVEINKLKKGALKLLPEDSEAYREKLADKIIELQNDNVATAQAYLRYLGAERQKLPVLVLDNCDKRIRDEQLLMFQVAQWIQKKFQCLIFLPLRNETYDNHRNEPPLDTALKDLVFRIEPPPFQSVLTERIKLALKEMEVDGGKKSFSLPNKMKVRYRPEEQSYFLESIAKSIFEHDAFARRMIIGLAGNNLRRAMEIFLEFCKSGYIGEDQIFKIRMSKGDHVLPYYVVANVIVRTDRRLYDGDSSYVKNILACNPADESPNYFVRLAALRWLDNRLEKVGPNNSKGYHSLRELKSSLVQIGMTDEVIEREVLYLMKAHCILAEHLKLDRVEDEDLIRLAPAGKVHLNLMENLEYLSAVAEDTYYDDESVAQRIARRIGKSDEDNSLSAKYKNAQDAVEYLDHHNSRTYIEPNLYLENPDKGHLTDMAASVRAIEEMRETIVKNNPWFEISSRIEKGEVVEGVVSTNHPKHGLFVSVEKGVDGLVHKSKLKEEEHRIEEGQKVNVKVLYVDEESKRIGLKLAR